jgi:hypothetical protein
MRGGSRYDSRPEGKGFSVGGAANPVVFRGVAAPYGTDCARLRRP